MTTFAYPHLLWLLLLLVPMAAYYVWRTRQGGAALQVSSVAGVAGAPRTARYYLRHLPFVLRCAALALLVVALARPRSAEHNARSTSEGIDIVLAIDISTSMLAQDLRPDRITAAREVAGSFIADRHGDRIGCWSRKKAVGVNFVLITVLSLPAILGFNVLSGIQPLGEGSNIMDMEDFLVSSNLLPLGSLVFVLFCVRKNGWGFENFLKEANEGEGIKFPHWIRLYMQYILPLIVVIIYLKGYYDMFSGKSTAVFVSWMCFAVLLLFVIFGVSIFTGRKKTGKVK